jgi:hypothetical protein
MAGRYGKQLLDNVRIRACGLLTSPNTHRDSDDRSIMMPLRPR